MGMWIVNKSEFEMWWYGMGVCQWCITKTKSESQSQHIADHSSSTPLVFLSLCTDGRTFVAMPAQQVYSIHYKYNTRVVQ